MLSSAVTVAVFLGAAAVTRAASCGNNYVSCSPPGATNTNPPQVGPNMSPLYGDLLDSVKGINFRRDDELVARDGPTMCCASGTSCLNLQTFDVPFCYDKFTTNYVFADGSYGTISSGEYHGAGGATANLLTGNYTGGGQSGNIYGNDASAKPNTATLSIPPQFTGTGVGSAIPITNLATVVLITTTIPATTLSPTTIPATTIPATTIPGSVVSGSTADAKTILATTLSASTVTAPTTITAHESVLTQTQPAAGSPSASASASAKSAATTPYDASSAALSALSAMTAVLVFALFAL